MGRRSKAAMAAEKASTQKPESTITGLERVENLPETTNPSLEKTEVQATAAMVSSKKTPGKHIVHTAARRSQRLKSALLPCQHEDIEQVIEEITLTESEDEDEEQHMHQEELKFKTTKGTFHYETSSYTEGKYRGLYIDSQKKIEALTEENHMLALKLENALGKLEGYEKGLEMAKEVVLVARATETAPKVCSEPIDGALAEIRSSKRTRRNQESGKT